MTDDELILEANELFARKKHLLQDVNRAVRTYCQRLTKAELKAVQESARAGFVLGYLEGKSDKS